MTDLHNFIDYMSTGELNWSATWLIWIYWMPKAVLDYQRAGLDIKFNKQLRISNKQ